MHAGGSMAHITTSFTGFLTTVMVYLSFIVETHVHISSLLLKLNWRRQWPPHSSTLAWKILWMEEPGRLQSMESQ